MADIRTKQIRTLRVQYTFVDKEANDETWLENCGIISAETGVDAAEIHRILFAQFPELFN